ncbi:MAG: hypothetical protein JSV03_12700 [Planctomycetota bacterium]|nr:MAG: hypothetical protein JSV03_12700 [Planctomycetota bacterium]
MFFSLKGLTLVEALIIIIVLGIIASVVVPQFTKAGTSDNLGALKGNLQVIRAQIKAYKLQHNNSYPSGADKFEDQMVRASKADGSTAVIGTPGYNWGPYLQSIPNNPYTDTNTIGSGEVGTSAWYYNPQTGLFRANHNEQFTGY